MDSSTATAVLPAESGATAAGEGAALVEPGADEKLRTRRAFSQVGISAVYGEKYVFFGSAISAGQEPFSLVKQLENGAGPKKIKIFYNFDLQNP